MEFLLLWKWMQWPVKKVLRNVVVNCVEFKQVIFYVGVVDDDININN